MHKQQQKGFFLVPARFAGCLLLSGLLISTICRADSPLSPDPQLTPGDVLSTDASVICVPGYTKTVRNVSAAEKKQVYENYGIETRQPREYEVDHLISLELGGSNEIANLWPESYITEPLNAHVKDQLENVLHGKVCAGEVPIDEAQRAIASDWISAYQKYVGPLPDSRP
jgi:hypothetical protein